MMSSYNNNSRTKKIMNLAAAAPSKVEDKTKYLYENHTITILPQIIDDSISISKVENNSSNLTDFENVDTFIEENEKIFNNDSVNFPLNPNNFLFDDLNEHPVTCSSSLNLEESALDEDPSNDFESKMLTKRGTKRKRRLYKSSLAVRCAHKIKSVRKKHLLKPPCSKCRKNCFQLFSEQVRQEINDQFWSMNKKGKKLFLLNSVQKSNVTLLPLMPENRKKFWLDLPCCENDDIDLYTTMTD